MSRDLLSEVETSSGIERTKGETGSEYLRRVGSRYDVDESLIENLVAEYNEVVFSPKSPDELNQFEQFLSEIKEANESEKPPTSEPSRYNELVDSDTGPPDNSATSQGEDAPSSGDPKHTTTGDEAVSGDRFRSDTETEVRSAGYDSLSTEMGANSEPRIGGYSEQVEEVVRLCRQYSLIILLLLTSILAVYVTLTKPVDYAFDAERYTFHARWYADTLHLGVWQSNSVHFDQSPVLRYTLYALLLKIVGIPDYSTSFRIALFLTSIIYYVVTPYFVYTLLSEGTNKKYAWAGIAGWLLYQLIAWPDHPIHAGKWQYAYTASLLFGSLVLANRGLQRTDWANIRNCALGTGVVLGIAGLTQYTYTMFAVVAITIASLRRRRFKFLGVVYVVGGVFLAYALIASSPEHFETTLQKTSEGPLGLRPLAEIERLLFSYGLGANILKISVGIVVAGWYVRERLMQTRLFETMGLVVLTFWIFSAFTGASPGGLGYVNQFVGGAMIFVSIGYLGFALFEKLDEPHI